MRVLLLLALLVAAPCAFAHEIWINRQGLKNPAGEWCCGAGDCGIIDGNSVRATKAGYELNGAVIYGAEITGNEQDGDARSEWIKEIVPYSQAQPSPDGAYWRCRRPDGSRRCFFAPPPGS